MKTKNTIKNKLLAFLLCLILITTSLIATGPTVPVSAAGETVSGTYFYDIAAQILVYVNEERAKNGLGALSMDADLQAAAMLRSVETTIRWEHTRPNGSVWYSVCDKSYGENIGQETGYSDPAYAAMYGDGSTGWMNSSAHKKNILGDYTCIGIGVFRNSMGSFYFVQEFGYNAPNTALHAQTQEAVSVSFDSKGNVTSGNTPAETPAPTTAKPTTEAPTTAKPTTEAPTTAKPTKPAQTTEDPMIAASIEASIAESKQQAEAEAKRQESIAAESLRAATTPVSIKATLVKSSYPVGYTLTGADFIVSITMEDGSVVNNATGWNASPLTVDGKTSITVSYQGVSTSIPASSFTEETTAHTEATTERPETKPVETSAKETTAKETTAKETTAKETSGHKPDKETSSLDETTAKDDETSPIDEPETTKKPSASGFSTDSISRINPLNSDEMENVTFIPLISDGADKPCIIGIIEYFDHGYYSGSSLAVKKSRKIYPLSPQDIRSFISDNQLESKLLRESTVIDGSVNDFNFDYSMAFSIGTTKHEIIKLGDGIYEWYISLSDGECLKVNTITTVVLPDTSEYEDEDETEAESEALETTTLEATTEAITASADSKEAGALSSSAKEAINENESSTISTSESTRENSSEDNSLQKLLIGAIIAVGVLLLAIIALLIVLITKKSKKTEEAPKPDPNANVKYGRRATDVVKYDRRSGIADRRGEGANGGRRSYDIQPEEEKPQNRATDKKAPEKEEVKKDEVKDNNKTQE